MKPEGRKRYQYGMNGLRWCFLLLLACGAGLLASGCSTTQKEEAARVAPPKHWPRVALEQDGSTLGQTVRHIGREVGGGLVMMNGVGNRRIPPVKVKRARYGKFAAQLAKHTSCLCEPTPWFFFLYPKEAEVYQPLLQVSLEGRLHPRYDTTALELLSGDRTPLHNVLTLLSQGDNITIIADNPVAGNLCGEIVLGLTPLEVVLEALLMSARVAPDTFQVDSTEEYIFLYGTGNRNPRSVLLNEEGLNDTQRALLEKRVSVQLPVPTDNNEQVYYADASSLSEVLGTLSHQLGVPVVADKQLQDFPVNPCVMNDVRLRTALDLLIRQWPIARFGYEVRGQDILIRAR